MKVDQAHIGRTIIKTNWIIDVKKNRKGGGSRYKTKLLAEGFSQIYEVDFHIVFLPGQWYGIIGLPISIAVNLKWKRIHKNVKNTFVNLHLKDKVYNEPPQGFTKKGKEQWVYRLQKGRYGLRQAPCKWPQHLDEYVRKCPACSMRLRQLFIH